MPRTHVSVGALSCALAVSVAVTSMSAPALACGGCFAPPGAATVVTDHRMVLSLSQERTVLWDQIRYAGSPRDFSWILPIRDGAGVRVEVASEGFVSLADGLTSPVLDRPPCLELSVHPSRERSTTDDVVVHQAAVVGPYAMVVVGGRDPAAIGRWLQANGYAVPAAVAPVLAHYTALSMDFVALRLRPGEGIDRMTPVRITTPGWAPVVPLRMVAAGAGDRVGLSLVVVAPSRMEARGFVNGELRDADFTWRWASPTLPARDFLTAFDAMNARAGGRLWLTESSLPFSATAWRAQAERVDAARREDARAVDDLALVTAGCGGRCVVTRMRAVLSRAALDRDLALDARDDAPRPRFYAYGTEVGAPTADCGDAPGVDAGVVDPRAPVPPQPQRRDASVEAGAGAVTGVDAGAADAAAVDEPAAEASGGCAVSRGARGGGAWALLAAAAAWASRRRRAGQLRSFGSSSRTTRR